MAEEIAAFFVLEEAGEIFGEVGEVVHAAEVFPKVFAAGAGVQAEKIGVGGEGLQTDGVLVAVGDFVLGECVCNEDFGFGSDSFAFLGVVFRSGNAGAVVGGGEGLVMIFNLLPDSGVVGVGECEWRDEGAMGGGEFLVCGGCVLLLVGGQEFFDLAVFFF